MSIGLFIETYPMAVMMAAFFFVAIASFIGMGSYKEQDLDAGDDLMKKYIALHMSKKYPMMRSDKYRASDYWVRKNFK